jgi:hypothetical protein
MYLNGTKCVAFALSCFLSLTCVAKNTVPTVGKGAQKPLCFVENKGQIAGNAQYTMTAPGMNLYLGNAQLHYQFRKTEGASGANPKMRTYRMDVTLLGANKLAVAEATELQDYFEVFYTSSSKAEGITAHTYNKVTYKEVYPGIDWVLYIKGDKVEYDFVVKPGADASLIKLQYGGATALNITADGGIAAETPMGKIQEKKPYAYDKAGREVAANFKLHKNVVSFETGKCNSTLTIDPYILWSSYFGGANEDVATCVKVSGGGNTYIGGYTSSTTVGFTGTGTPYDVTFNGSFDAFISKYDIAGTRQFTTYFGGAGNDRGTCIAIDAAGTGIFMGGYTTGSTGMASGGAYHGANNGLTDGFLIKINNNGTRQWSTYYGGTGNDYVYGITCDASNNPCITGRTESAATIASGGVFQTTRSGSADAFVAKFASGSGANSFSTYYGGTGVDEASGIASDASNNLYITGQTNSVTNIATTGAHQTALSGTQDAFIGKLNSTGTTQIWGTYFGSTGSEQGNEVVCNTLTGDVGIVGYTTSTSGIATPNAHQTIYGGGVQDAFVAYFTSVGDRAWSTYYGGPALDFGESICLDPSRNIVIAGGTFSTTGIASAGSLQPTIGGNYDAFSAKFTPLGQRIWGSYFGDALYDYAFGVTCDGGGQIIMAGHTTSTAGIASAGSAQTVYGGGTYDAFVTKFRPDTFALINQPFTDTLICAGGNLTISYAVNFAFRPGNNFTAQLSNAAGSFAAPINIGTSVAVGSGNIVCTIPGGTPVGSGYRIRIVASNPSYTSPDEFTNIQVVSILPSPTVMANTPVCVGNTLNLSASAPWAVTSYLWNGPAAFSSASATPSIPSVTLANAGTYSVTMTHNGCPNTVAPIAVVVNSVIPTSPVAFASALNCNGGSIYLYADTGMTTTATYSWSGPGGYSSTMQNPVISPISITDGGTYNVIDTVAGCPSLPTPVTVVVTPNAATSVNITVSPNDTVCGGSLVSFAAFPINGGISPTYQWMNGPAPIVGAISSMWSSSTLTDGAMITCLMTSNAVCPLPATATSNLVKMNVITNEPLAYIFANPGTSVNPGDSIVFTSAVYNVGVGPTYQWQRNGVDIGGATNTSYTLHSVTAYDTISLIVTSTMGCSTSEFATSNKLVAHPNTAVAEVSSALDNVRLFPNPNSGTFNIAGDLSGTGARSVSVAILNPLGQIIYKEESALHNGLLDAMIQSNNLSNGIYLLQISSDGRSKTIRFTVQR